MAAELSPDLNGRPERFECDSWKSGDGVSSWESGDGVCAPDVLEPWGVFVSAGVTSASNGGSSFFVGWEVIFRELL